MDLKLKDRVAVITGGTRGIGRMAALRFAEEGCAVAICGRNQDSLQATLADLRALGVPAYGEVADVMRGEDVQRFVDNSARQLGGVDALVCSAGGSMGIRGILGPSDEDWQKV